MENIKTVDDLRQAFPALVAQIEQAAADRATDDERKRIQDIQEMALPGSEQMTAEAMFTKPVSAADYAKAAMKLAKEQGSKYLDGAKQDAENGGVNGVKGEAPDGKNDATGGKGKEDEFMDAIKNLGKTQKQ